MGTENWGKQTDALQGSGLKGSDLSKEENKDNFSKKREKKRRLNNGCGDVGRIMGPKKGVFFLKAERRKSNKDRKGTRRTAGGARWACATVVPRGRSLELINRGKGGGEDNMSKSRIRAHQTCSPCKGVV